MREMFRKCKEKIAEHRALVVGTTIVTSILAPTTALADGTAATGTADTSVTSAFQTAGNNIMATLGVISASAVGIMVIIMAWRYGKKLFKTVAN